MIQELALATILAFLSGTVGSGEMRIVPPVPASDVSIVSLLANPSSWDGKNVRVAGVLSWGFENQYIYLDCESFRMRNTSNALVVDLTVYHGDSERIEKMHALGKKHAGSYVLLGGEFKATPNLDHPEASMITNVFRIQSWHEIINSEKQDVVCQ